MSWKLFEGDCLEVMPTLEDNSIDMILCDLPYGTTACKWDTIIPFEPLWREYERLIKPNGAIVLTASQPFTTKLINSNIKLFRYELIWEKTRPTEFLNANKMPMRSHENILIFYGTLPTYNPQMKPGKPYIKNRKANRSNLYNTHLTTQTINTGERYPYSVIKIASEWEQGMHPTQKPVALFEYLIKTYTNEGDLVLDNCAGSGTTGVACQNLNRNCIMIEQEPEYCDIIRERMKETESLLVEQRKQTTLPFKPQKDLSDFIPAK